MSKYFSMWIGKPPSMYEVMSYLSHVKFGHQITVYSDSKIKLPNEILQRSIFDILSESEFKKFSAKPNRLSDRFRYLALEKLKSEIWVDADVVCLSSNDLNFPYIYGYESKKDIAMRTLAIPQASPLLKLLIEKSSNSKDQSWSGIGPTLLNKSISKLNLGHLCQEKSFFYPIGPYEIDLLIDPKNLETMQNLVSKSYSVHLYNEMLVRACLPKNILPPKGSFLDKLLSELEIDSERIERLSEEWLTGWRKNFRERQIFLNISRKIPYKNAIRKIVKN